MAIFQVVFNLLSFTFKKSELCLDLAVATLTLVSGTPWIESLSQRVQWVFQLQSLSFVTTGFHYTSLLHETNLFSARVN